MMLAQVAAENIREIFWRTECTPIYKRKLYLNHMDLL